MFIKVSFKDRYGTDCAYTKEVHGRDIFIDVADFLVYLSMHIDNIFDETLKVEIIEIDLNA